MTTATFEPITTRQRAFIETLMARKGTSDEESQNYRQVATRQQASHTIEFLLALPDAKAEVVTPPVKTPAPTVDLPKRGIFTVVGPKGGHRTLRLKEGAGYFEGKTIFQAMTGPDNERSYTSFGNLESDGSMRIWVKTSFDRKDEFVAALKFLASGGLERLQEAGMAYALESGCCYRCNRTLTVPASIHRGLGPDCAKMVG